MATTAKDASHGKEKTKSPSQKTDLSQGRRPTKSHSTGTSDKGILLEKPSPHYLKPTISSTKDVCKYVKKQSSDDTHLKYLQTRRKSIDKPPSPSQLQRTLSGGPRGRTLKLSSSSPPPKKTISPKPLPERISRTPKNGKVQPVATKPVSTRKSPSPGPSPSSIPKRGTRPTKTPSTSANNTPTSVDTTETPPTVKPEEEEKGKQVEEVHQGTDKCMGEEVGQHEMPANEHLIELSVEEEKHKHETSSLEEKELVEDPVEETKEKTDELVQNDDEKKNITEEHSNENEESQNDPEESKLGEEAEANGGDEGGIQKEKKVIEEGVEEKPYKLKFKQGKELEENEGEDEGPQKLKFKERNVESEDNEDVKAESENVVLKKKDVHGKKEQPAYNDVIEETAKKLAEKRKNRVLALAGAFETVISLQDSEGQQSEGDK